MTIRAMTWGECPKHGQQIFHYCRCVSCHPPGPRPPPSGCHENTPIGEKPKPDRWSFSRARVRQPKEYFGQPPTKREKQLLELALTDMRVVDMGRVIGASKSSAWGSLRAGLWKVGHETRASYQQHMARKQVNEQGAV